MDINGSEATVILESFSDRVVLHKKDNTDKLWSYKIKSSKRTEFAFDPNTKTKLSIWVDRIPPSINGLTDIERVSGKNTSTALERVFSGGIHKANYNLKISNADALISFIEHYESL